MSFIPSRSLQGKDIPNAFHMLHFFRTTLAGSDSEEKCREALKQKDIYIVELEHYTTSLQRTLSEKTDTNE